MTKKVAVLYLSGSGNTRAIADHIVQVFSELDRPDVELELIDAQDLDFEALKTASGFIIGTPNYFSAPSGYVKVFFDELFPHRSVLNERPVFCFVSHGGGGDVETLKRLCNWLELDIVGPNVVVRGKRITPQDTTLIKKNLEELLGRI